MIRYEVVASRAEHGYGDAGGREWSLTGDEGRWGLFFCRARVSRLHGRDRLEGAGVAVRRRVSQDDAIRRAERSGDRGELARALVRAGRAVVRRWDGYGNGNGYGNGDGYGNGNGNGYGYGYGYGYGDGDGNGNGNGYGYGE